MAPADLPPPQDSVGRCADRDPLRPRLAVLELIIPEYKTHLFEGIYSHPGIELLVVHSGKGDRDDAPAVLDGMRFPARRVPTIRFPLPSGKRLHFQAAIKTLREFRPDLVVLQDGLRIISNVWVARWCREGGIKIGYYTHGRNLQASAQKGLFRTVAERTRLRILRQADVVIAYSSGVAEELLHAGVGESRIVISPNTLDVQAIHFANSEVSDETLAGMRRQLGIGNAAVVIYMGRLVHGKRPGMLLEAVSLARQCGVDVHLIMAGEGPLLACLRGDATRLGIPVTFLGHLPILELSGYLKLAKVVCIPGMTGLAIVHAFAAGKPYVTCDVPEHGPEIGYLRPGHNGVLVSPATAGSLGKALVSLLRDDERLKQMGRNAESVALRECSPEAQVKGFVRAILVGNPGIRQTVS